MIRKHLQLLCLIALALPFLTACKEDKEFVAPSNKQLLVAHEWQGDEMLMMGISVSEAGAIPNGIPDIQTITLTFNSDNTYVAKSSDGMIFEGDWRFNEEETKIYFDFLGFGEFDIRKLTSENLNLSTGISKGQLTLLAQMLNIDLSLINMFPDGTEFETELRFVKP
ncbi:hypothetical protein [Pontibacter diazotrophicus]|nr:hypothetical protein [Pontibacter diazotrophicus]